MRRLLHTLQARDTSLVVWHFGRYAYVPMGDHDGHVVRGYLFILIAHSLWSYMGYVAAPELP
jgi:hypothetical protein